MQDKYKITAIMKVEAEIIASITANLTLFLLITP
jgi:hypothetical protein